MKGESERVISAVAFLTARVGIWREFKPSKLTHQEIERCVEVISKSLLADGKAGKFRRHRFADSRKPTMANQVHG